MTFTQTPPPAGTGTTLLVLGADGTLGRDELQRLLYGGRVSLTVAVGATLLALLICRACVSSATTRCGTPWSRC